MPQVKIVEPGWEGYTGHLGTVHFTDGVSDEILAVREAQRLGCIVRMEDVDTGENPSATQHAINTRAVGADEALDLQAGQAAEPEVVVTPTPQYTKEDLEKLADEKGIKPLREIGESLGVKDASIAGLIRKILEKAGARVSEPASTIETPADPDTPADPEGAPAGE